MSSLCIMDVPKHKLYKSGTNLHRAEAEEETNGMRVEMEGCDKAFYFFLCTGD